MSYSKNEINRTSYSRHNTSNIIPLIPLHLELLELGTRHFSTFCNVIHFFDVVYCLLLLFWFRWFLGVYSYKKILLATALPIISH